VPEPLATDESLTPPAAGSAPLLGAARGHDRLVAALEVAVCSDYPTQFLISSLLIAAGLAPTKPGGTELSLPFVLTLSMVDTLVLIVLMVLLMRARGESATELWLGHVKARREALIGLSLVPAVFLMVVVLLNLVRLLMPSLHNVAINPLEQLAGNTAFDAAMFGLVAIIAGGVREELQRAFLLHRFKQHLGGATVGVIIISVLFGLGHATQGWDAVITTGALGMFWAVLYLDRRSSIAPVVSHAGFNSLEILRVVFFVS